MSAPGSPSQNLAEFAAVHEALLRAGLAWTAGDQARAAGDLDDVAVLARDLAADLRNGEPAA